MASTVLMPTERSSVLLPDIFEPLTSNTRVAPDRSTSLRTLPSAEISGWPRPVALNAAGPSRNSGNGSSGCSKLYPAIDSSASISPSTLSQVVTACPCRRRQHSAASVEWTVYISGSSSGASRGLRRASTKLTRVASCDSATDAAPP